MSGITSACSRGTASGIEMSANSTPGMLTANAPIASASNLSPCVSRPVTNVTRRPVRSIRVSMTMSPSAGGAK